MSPIRALAARRFSRMPFGYQISLGFRDTYVLRSPDFPVRLFERAQSRAPAFKHRVEDITVALDV